MKSAARRRTRRASDRRRRPTLEDAIVLAARAHRGQLDKGGQPYILHPLRVMNEVSGAEAKMAAVLHDVVEDTPVTLARLRAAGFSETVVRAVDALSRRPGEDYLEYVERAGRNRIARQVKLADLRDNLAPARLGLFAEEHRRRLRKKYRDAFARLGVRPTPRRSR